MIEFAAHWGHCPKNRKILISIAYRMIWCIWNHNVFKQDSHLPCKNGGMHYLKSLVEIDTWLIIIIVIGRVGILSI